MIAVKGIYQGGDIVKLDSSTVPVHEPYEVIVEFINPLKQFEESDDKSVDKSEEKQARREKAFQHFMQYRGILPADFDYKKELAEYRDERYGHIN